MPKHQIATEGETEQAGTNEAKVKKPRQPEQVCRMRCVSEDSDGERKVLAKIGG